MALKVLYKGTVPLGQLVDTYTCPTGKTTICTINISNSTPGSAILISILIGGVMLENQVSVGETYERTAIILGADETIQISSSEVVDVRIYGSEE